MWKKATLKNAKCPVPVMTAVTMSTGGTLKLYPYDHGLDALDEGFVTDLQVEIDVVLPDGRKMSGLRATMGQAEHSSEVHLILPADPLSVFVVGQQQRPFSLAWVDGGKKPGFDNSRSSGPWRIAMTFQQELVRKATPSRAKAAQVGQDSGRSACCDCYPQLLPYVMVTQVAALANIPV